MSEDNSFDERRLQGMWADNIGNVKDTYAYNCLIILMEWIKDLYDVLDDIRKAA